MRSPARIIDISAIQRYVAAEDLAVSTQLAVIEAVGHAVLAPATCLAEAFWAVRNTDEAMLDVFHTLPQVSVAPLEAIDASTIGGMARFMGSLGMARFMGSLGMAHACLMASWMDMPLLTADPALASKFLPPNLIWEI